MRRRISTWCALAVCLSTQSQVLETSIYFSSGSAQLTAEAQTKLREVKTILNQHEVLEFTIEGHTDHKGSATYNQHLAEERIESTLAHLNPKKDLLRVVAKSPFGERKPLSSNVNELGRALNRRVDIRISYQIINPEPDDIQTLFKQLATEPNTYCINPKRDTVLVGSAGGIIELKANIFDLPKTQGDQCVRVLMRENFSMSSMLLDNLSTLSNGEILESDGMIDLAAFDWQGKPLKLKKGKEMLILIPTQNKLEDIQYFDGLHQGNNSLNWSPISSSFDNLSGVKNINEANACVKSRKCTGYERCRLGCKIEMLPMMISGMGDSVQRKANRELRALYCSCRNSGRGTVLKRGLFNRWIAAGNRIGNDDNACIELTGMFKKYNVSDVQTLNDTLKKIRLKEIETALHSGEGTINDLNYYAFSKTNLGLANCDRFSKYPEGQLVTMRFGVPRDENTNIRVAFEKEKVIMQAYEGKGEIELTRIPKGKKVWVIALKVVQGVFMMDLFQTVVGQKIPEINFKIVSLDEIKIAFKRFDP